MSCFPKKRFLSSIAVLFLAAFAASAGSRVGDDTQALLDLHKQLIDAHKKGDVNGVLGPEDERIVMVSRGEVRYATKKERVPEFEKYLARTEFKEYNDLIDPIVSISKDGTMGWVIAQVKIAGTQTGDHGEHIAFESVWAWIELYEKKDDRWRRVGEVSNMKPGT